MEQYNNYQQERELGWDDEIVKDAEEYIFLPDGDYDFVVESVERARFNGSDKSPACNMAKVKVCIAIPQGETHLTTNLMLHSKYEWKLSSFFASIGLKKEGQPLKMNWNIAGYRGKCSVGHREYNGSTYNDIKKFYPAEASPTPQYQGQNQTQTPQQNNSYKRW